MKQIIRNILKGPLWRLSDRYLASAARRHFPAGAADAGRSPRHFVVLTLSGVGSLGDEAMVNTIVTQIQAKMPEARITLLTHHPEDDPSYAHFGVEVMNLKGFFAPQPPMEVCERLGKLFATATDFLLPGADVLDGRYLPSRSYRRLLLGKMAERVGLRVFVLGFSFSDKAVDYVKSYLRRDCQGFAYMCRDPLSAERMSQVLGRPVEHGADLAFNLPIPEAPLTEPAARAEAQIAAWRAEGRKITVLNANPLSLTNVDPTTDLDAAARDIAAGIGKLGARTGSAFLFLTHDNRPAASDAAFMEKIIAALEPGLTFHFVPETVRAMDIKRLCRQVDLTVTGRMHLGIASLGGGTATMLIDYQGKVQGLLEMFDLPQMALDVSGLRRPEVFCDTVADRFERSEAISATVRKNLDKIHALSARNMNLVFDAV